MLMQAPCRNKKQSAPIGCGQTNGASAPFLTIIYYLPVRRSVIVSVFLHTVFQNQPAA